MGDRVLFLIRILGICRSLADTTERKLPLTHTHTQTRICTGKTPTVWDDLRLATHSKGQIIIIIIHRSVACVYADCALERIKHTLCHFVSAEWSLPQSVAANTFMVFEGFFYSHFCLQDNPSAGWGEEGETTCTTQLGKVKHTITRTFSGRFWKGSFSEHFQQSSPSIAFFSQNAHNTRTIFALFRTQP